MDKEFTAYANHLNENIPITDNRSRVARNIYAKCIKEKVSENKLKQMLPSNLHSLHNSLSDLFYYSRDNHILIDINTILNIKQRNGENINKLVQQQFHRHITIRDFVSAQTIKESYPSISFPAIPNITKTELTTKNIIIAKNNELEVTSFAYPDEKLLIIIGSPYCNASSRFFQWLNKDREFAKMIKKHSFILLNDNIYPNVDTIRYIESFTLLSTKQVYKSVEWPEIKYWGTPSFYLIEKGVLKDRYEGWPHKDGELKFKNFIEKNKLMF